ncbi:hypothetical protein NJ76_28990, partial [Rhodococcus sp. IITR03]
SGLGTNACRGGTATTRGAGRWDRAFGRIPADTGLLETPARNLPPLDRRDSPMHYSPKVTTRHRPTTDSS